MIDKNSFELYDSLVEEDNYKYMFDLGIIYQVSETLNMLEKELDSILFENLCDRVKRNYLKYDKDLNDTLVEETIEEMGI